MQTHIMLTIVKANQLHAVYSFVTIEIYKFHDII